MLNSNTTKAFALTVLLFLVGVLAGPAYGQAATPRVLKKQMDPSEVVSVATALGRITLIDLPEPPDMVVAGDTAAFKIEALENKIMIQPLDAKAATNLFVWTAAGRLNFNLVTRCAEAEFNHVIDFTEDPALRDAAELRRKELETVREEVMAEQKEKFLASLLSSPYRVPPKKKSEKRVAFYFQEAISIDDVMYVRYVLVNDTDQSFMVKDPELRGGILLSDPDRMAIPPYGLQNGDAKLHKLHVRPAEPPTLIEHRVQKAHLSPGERTTGVLVVRFSPMLGRPAILSATFPAVKTARTGASVVIH